MELHKFKVLQGDAGAGCHGTTITSTGVGGGGREVGTPIATSGQDGVVGAEAMESSILQAQGHHSSALASIIHDQVQSKVLHCSKQPRQISQGAPEGRGAGGTTSAAQACVSLSQGCAPHGSRMEVQIAKVQIWRFT